MLSRLLSLHFDGNERSFTLEQRNEMRLNLDHVVESKILQINYMSYDIHRAYDCVRPDSRSFLMTLSREEDPDHHPFWYCQLLKAFHIKVHFCSGGVSHSKETLEVFGSVGLGLIQDTSGDSSTVHFPRSVSCPNKEIALPSAFWILL